TQKSYNNLGTAIGNARLAGLIAWTALEDRTRFLRGLESFNDPSQVLKRARDAYRCDLWENQEYRPEVWIEKDALVGVIEGICNELRIDYFACRGYSSLSEQ